MTYMPINAIPTSPMISCISIESLSAAMTQIGAAGTATSGAWPSANLAVYVPFSLRRLTTIYGLWNCNTSPASGNIDLGIYATDGRKIVSTGSFAMSGTSQVQTKTITPVTIGPGSFYLAMAESGTTGAFIKFASSVVTLHTLGVLQQASALPLPPNATFATASQAYLPIFGILTTPTLATGVPLLFINVNDITTTSENHTP